MMIMNGWMNGWTNGWINGMMDKIDGYIDLNYEWMN